MLNANKRLLSFALPPLMRDNTGKPQNNVLSQNLKGGFARQRTQFIGDFDVINVSVSLHSPSRERYFWAFWELHQKKPQPFIWALKRRGNTEFVNYECQFVFGSEQESQRRGHSYSVSFQAIVKQTSLKYDPEIYVAIYNNTDGDPDRYFNLLEKLVNEALPDALNGPN